MIVKAQIHYRNHLRTFNRPNNNEAELYIHDNNHISFVVKR